MMLASKYLKNSQFSSLSDFQQNLELIIPENFNFAYDVADEYARKEPDKVALVWANDRGRKGYFLSAT